MTAYLSKSRKSVFKTFSKMPIRDRGEDTCHGALIKLINGDNLEMSCEASSDVIATTARGTHSANK